MLPFVIREVGQLEAMGIDFSCSLWNSRADRSVGPSCRVSAALGQAGRWHPQYGHCGLIEALAPTPRNSIGRCILIRALK